MPDFSKRIIYLSDVQRQELFTNGTITVDGVTVTYDENDIYVTPQAEPVTDVRVNGISVNNGGVANVPIGGISSVGVVKRGGTGYSIDIGNDGALKIVGADSATIKIANSNSSRPILPVRQHESTFYGLAKAAGHDEASSTESVGTYTPEAKGAIQQMLGVSDLIATAENSLVASRAYAIGNVFTANGKLYKATAAIAVNDTIVLQNSGETISGSNAEEIKLSDYAVHDVQVNGSSVMQGGVANMPIAGANNFGVVKVANQGVALNSNNVLQIVPASLNTIKSGTGNYSPISVAYQHASTFYGLAKAAGDTTQSQSDNAVGTYTDEAKAAIKNMIGVNVEDVQINGISVVNDGIADIPMASGNTFGVVKCSTTVTNGVKIGVDGILSIAPASSANIKNGNMAYNAITSATQHESTFYGLAKASGDTTQAQSSNAVGTYTPEAKGAIQSMLGVSDLIATAENSLVASKAYAIGDIFTANGKLYKATAAIAADAAIIPEVEGEEIAGANCAETSIGEGFVKKTDYADGGKPGIVQLYNAYGITKSGGYPTTLQIYPAGDVELKAGTHGYRPVVPLRNHTATFYGLAKAAGDTTQSQSDNAVGTYTDNAKAAIKSMIGVNVEDVQIDEVSVVTNGIANIPIASASTFGVVKCGTGLSMMTGSNAGKINTNPASTSACKNGAEYYAPITPNHQHEATFYGLAKAAGDTTQSASSNAVGTYTDNAKASIKSMLGIIDGSTGTVDVTGTTPTIVAVENTRYVCGEVTSLDFTPAASGICIVRFTSGSTVTVLTLPSTVKFPEWFDATTLETNTIYEICITDGVYGAVMSWAL